MGDQESDPSISCSEDWLAGLPPPKHYPLLQLVFALIFGTGVQWRGVYFVNILLLLVIFASFGSGVYFFADVLTSSGLGDGGQALAHPGNRERAYAGVTMTFTSLMLVFAMHLAAFVCGSVYIHDKRNEYGLVRAGFPCPPARQQAPHSCSSSTRRGWCSSACACCRLFNWRQGTWFVDLATILTVAVPLCQAIAMFLGQTFDQTPIYVELPPSPPNTSLPRSIICLQVIATFWGSPAVAAVVLLFYALTDDVVLVISSTSDRLCALARRSTASDGCNGPAVLQRSTSFEVHLLVSAVRDLQAYVDGTLATTKKWFVIHMIVFFLSSVFWILSILLLVSSGTGTQREDVLKSRPLYLLTKLFFFSLSFLIPLHAAARVTLAWSRLVTSVCTSPAWVKLGGHEYQSVVLFLEHWKGGFRVLDYAVVHKSGLQVFAVMVTLAGLARYV